MRKRTTYYYLSVISGFRSLLIILLSGFLFCGYALSQETGGEDSLKMLIKTARHDTSRISNMMKLAEMIYYEQPDSAIALYEKARSMSEKLILTSSSTKGGNPKVFAEAKKHLAFAFYNLAYVNDDFGETSVALEYYQKSLDTYIEIASMPEKETSKYGKQGMANVYNDLGYTYRHQGDFERSLEYYNKSLKINKELGDMKQMATLLNNIGILYRSKGDMSTALEYSFKSLETAEKINDNEEIAYAINSIAYLYDNQGNLPKALEYYQRNLKIYEKIGNKHGLAITFNNIAYVYFNQEDYSKSLEYYNKAAEVFDKAGDKKSQSITLNNIGAAYEKLGDVEKAFEQYQRSLDICEETGYQQGIVIALGNLGLVLEKKGDVKGAFECYDRGTRLSEEMGDKQGLISSLTNLGALYFECNDNSKALLLGERAYKLSLEVGFPSYIRYASALLKKVYRKQGNYKKALEFYELEIKMRDSITNEDNYKQAMKQQARYEYEKKSATDSIAHAKAMEIKNLQMAKIEEEKEKQKIMLLSFILGFIIILVFSVVVFRLFIQKRKANIILAEQKMQIEMQNKNLQQANEEISTQRDEIEAQRDEISAQRDLVTEQKEHIEEQKKEITDSITYAKRIQNAVLPDLSLLFGNQLSVEENVDNTSTQPITDHRSLVTDYFVLFKPKDIVSGDFYWGAKIDEWLVFTVADCTGHGVPGAFMSMLGISFLNEIVRKKEVTKTGEVLDHLRNSIIEALKQKGISGEQKDGMDIVLCVLNTKTLALQFSGANNPLYIIKQPAIGHLPLAVGLLTTEANGQKPKANSQEPIANSQLIEIKPDLQPVAIHVNMKPFTTNEVQLQKGDCLYLTTDGFPDQFGGPKNKKFMIKRLKDLFAKISEKPMGEQCEILKTSFVEWKGDHEQVDDVTVMGIKI